MSRGRLEAFSDGVIAIIVTIMVLELKVPHDTTLAALRELLPRFLSYTLSFLVVAIMWVNHHHMMHTVKRVDAALLWCNNLLLFWMSLIPFVTGYMGENHAAPLPVALYGGVLTLAATSFTLLRFVLIDHEASDPELRAHHEAVLRKNLFSTALYASSVPIAFVSVNLSFAVFLLIPVLYFLPERKLEEAP